MVTLFERGLTVGDPERAHPPRVGLVTFDIVVPTLGRATLPALMESLARARGPSPERLVLVDDRREPNAPLDLGSVPDEMRARIRVLDGRGRGPAAARNVGWRASRSAWIAFLDDDVIVDDDWFERLRDDLSRASETTAGSQGRVRVPLPSDRAATDWERNVAALETAPYITADCAYRRRDLIAVGGFDERFPRAYREDSDLALRILANDRAIDRGTRAVRHPARAADRWNSVRLQAGNADDVLIEALHGDAWDRGEPPSTIASQTTTVAAALVAALALGVWAARTLRFAWKRIAPGPRTASEIATMLATSALIPFAAVGHRMRARARVGRRVRDVAHAPKPAPAAVFFDRDGTLIEDVPGNRDPARVRPLPGAREALQRLRERGTITAIVTNQPGVAEGRLTLAESDAIASRVEELLGPFDAVLACTHAANAGCACRKPEPGLIERGLALFALDARDCIVVGDIGSDMEAARRCGARGILVPNAATRPEEIAAAAASVPTLAAAVDLMLLSA